MSKLNKVQEAWSKSVGRQIEFEIKEVKTADGREQTQLINPETGSIVVAVNLTGDEARKKLVENAGAPFLDAAFTWAEIEGPNQANQLDKSDFNVKAPAGNPGPAVEAPKSEDADKLEEDRE